MKKTLLLLSLVLPVSVNAARHGCPLENTVYFAYDSKNIKAVELCQIGEYYRFTYGPTKNPELIITKPVGAGEVLIPLVEEGNGFEIVDGNSVYRVFDDDLDGPHIIFFSRTPFKEVGFSILNGNDKRFIDKTNIKK